MEGEFEQQEGSINFRELKEKAQEQATAFLTRQGIETPTTQEHLNIIQAEMERLAEKGDNADRFLVEELAVCKKIGETYLAHRRAIKSRVWASPTFHGE